MHFNGGVDPSSALEQALAGPDGTVTAALERLVGEPVDATARDHRMVPARRAAALEVPDGLPLIARAATLQGRHSGSSFVEAVSLLVPSRLPVGFDAKLQVRGQPIGRLLEAEGVEVIREPLPRPDPQALSVWPDAAPLDAAVRLARTYRLVAGGDPVMVISEWFLRALDPFLGP